MAKATGTREVAVILVAQTDLATVVAVAVGLVVDLAASDANCTYRSSVQTRRTRLASGRARTRSMAPKAG